MMLRLVGRRRCPLATLLIALVWPAAARAQTPGTPAPVTISIAPFGHDVYRATVVFPAGTDRPAAAAALDTLTQRSGWQVGGVEWQDTPAQGDFPAQILVSFQLNTLFPNGEFPVEAFAVSFRAWSNVYVAFDHGGAFTYRGERRYKSPGAVVEVTPSPTSLTLHYEISDRNLQRLDARPPMGLKPPEAAAPARRIREPHWAVLAAAGAVIVWVLVYTLMGGVHSGGRRPRNGKGSARP